MNRNRLKLFTLVTVSVTITLCLAEAGVRILDLEPKPLEPLPIPSYQLSSNPVLLYEYRPNYQPADAQYDKLHKGHKTNKDGFRDYEYSIKKPDDIIRLIVLGDSTTAGNGISTLDDIYSKKLEKLLNDRGSKEKFQILNMGVGGYHTVQEVETLKTKGLKYQPDFVFILFCMNDFSIESDGGVYKKLLEKNSNLKLNFESGFYKSLHRKSRLLFLIHYRIKILLSGEKKDTPEEWYKENILKGETTAKVGMSMLSKLQQKHGFKAYIYILPAFDHQFDLYRHRNIHSKVLEIGKHYHNIEVIDLLEDFQKENNNANIFSFDGLHMNKYGHKVLSEILFHKIKVMVNKQ